MRGQTRMLHPCVRAVGWLVQQTTVPVRVFSVVCLGRMQVHKAWREGYGAAYGEGDVVGCLLHLGEGGRPFEPTLAGERRLAFWHALFGWRVCACLIV